ncbi:hypothetical protein C8R43DRAFT_1081367 [Mycena crocata]|nr:hypothetical protein C8R43DRAFT_1081367 [Mycena crocata]
MLPSILVLVPFIAGINAANDWTKPCTSGECSYDIPATNGSSSGTVKIWGSENAITDITKAAGWQILGCDPSALAQDIRLVCMDDPADPNSKCAHLYQNSGAVNKIVRLPEECGANAFARISKSWVPEDQSIPASVSRRLVRRDGAKPAVKALALDTDFGAADYSKTGEVNFALMGANVPGVALDFPGTPAIKTRRAAVGLERRVFGLERRIFGLDTIKKAAEKVGEKIKDVAGDVKDKVGDVVDAVKDNKISADKKFDLPPLNFNKDVNLIDASLDCAGSVAGAQGSINAALRVDLSANANAQASITVAAEGKLIPPSITSFGVIAGLTANVAGSMTMTADIFGQIDSGKRNIVTIGVPGLSFPGILTIGPSFKVDTQVIGEVDLTMDMTVGLNFDVTNAQLAFPPNAANKVDGNAFKAGDTPLSLSADASVQATGSLTVHLIPSINLGVDALGGKGKAEVFLALDTNAALTMNLDGSASGEKVKQIGGAGKTNGTKEETAAKTNGAAEATTDDDTDPAAADDAAADEETTEETEVTDDSEGITARAVKRKAKAATKSKSTTKPKPPTKPKSKPTTTTTKAKSTSTKPSATPSSQAAEASASAVDTKTVDAPAGTVDSSTGTVDLPAGTVDAPTDGTVDDTEVLDGTEETSDAEGPDAETTDDAEVVDETTSETADETTDETADETTDETADETVDETADDAETTDDSETVDEESDETVDETADDAESTDDSETVDEDSGETTTDDADTDDSDTVEDDSEAAEETVDETTDDSESTDDSETVDEDSDETAEETANETESAGDSEVVEDDSEADEETVDDSEVADDSEDADDSETTEEATDDETTTDETTDEELDPTTIDNSAGSEDASGTDAEAPPTTKTIGGCVRVNGGFNVKAGVEGSFFGLFNEVKAVSLFNKNFKIFEKCFGDQKPEAIAAADAAATAASDAAAAESADPSTAKPIDDATTTRRSARLVSRLERQRLARLQRRFTCPTPGAIKSAVTDGTVKASDITTS